MSTLPVFDSKEIATRQAMAGIKALLKMDVSDIPAELMEAAGKLAGLQIAAGKITTEAKIQNADIGSLVDTFINRFDSKYTQKAYRAAIKALRAWTQGQGVNVLAVSGDQADNFASFLRSTMSARSANVRINSVSSFYGWLQKRGHITSTPFTAIKRAGVALGAKWIPTTEDITNTVYACNQPASTAIRVLALTGLRVGALLDKNLCVMSSRKVKNGGALHARSKGKDIIIHVDQDVKDLVNENKEVWQAMGLNALTVAIKRAFTKACKQGSAHSIRHSFAVNLYKSSGHDVEAVRKALCHTNVAITTTYLQGLGAA